MTLTCDTAQLRAFVTTVFAKSDGKGSIHLRAFPDASQSRVTYAKMMCGADDLDGVVKEATKIINRAAGEPNAIVFCPPVCTFQRASTKSREADMHEGLCVSVELDTDPEFALTQLSGIIGEPTLVVESGGLWHNEVLEEDQPKLHVYWVLDKPVTGNDGLARLKYARRMAATVVKGDVTNVPSVHPIRWPGSWHRKKIDAPRPCRIRTASGLFYGLEQIVHALQGAMEAGGLPAVSQAGIGERVDDRDTKDLIVNVATGKEFHPSLAPLAMRLAVQKLPKDTTVAILQGLMESSGSTADERWRARYAEIPAIVASAYSKVDFNNSPLWTQRLVRTATGAVANSWQNLHIAFTEGLAGGKALRRNIRSNKNEVAAPLPWDPELRAPRPWTDVDATKGAVWLAQAGFPKIKPSEVETMAAAAAHSRGYDPVKTWLSGLEWDGIKRIDTWIEDYCRPVIDNENTRLYVRGVGRRWLISAVARAFAPGCKVDTILIFEGGQGTRKSTAVEILAGGFFANFSTSVALSNKDAGLTLAGPWIMEVAELAGLNKHDTDAVKEFLSRGSDRYREPYARTTEDHPRTVVFMGTINPDGNPYLQDTTGNRRFWPIRLDEKKLIDTEGLTSVRDQLWAESAHEFRRGSKWFIDSSALALVAEQEQAKRAVSAEEDPWFTDIARFIRSSNLVEINITDLARQALFISPKDVNLQTSKRLAIILRALGFAKRHTRDGNLWEWEP